VPTAKKEERHAVLIIMMPVPAMTETRPCAIIKITTGDPARAGRVRKKQQRNTLT
jgi:hypothetical protein